MQILMLLTAGNSSAINLPMNLTDYLQTTTQAEFAKRLGVTQGLVTHWVNGRTRITAERAVQIEQVTDGQVTRHELRPDIFGAHAQAKPEPEPRSAA
jgi:transcriptional regulator with XRE-family HTH domain